MGWDLDRRRRRRLILVGIQEEEKPRAKKLTARGYGRVPKRVGGRGLRYNKVVRG